MSLRKLLVEKLDIDNLIKLAQNDGKMENFLFKIEKFLIDKGYDLDRLEYMAEGSYATTYEVTHRNKVIRFQAESRKEEIPLRDQYSMYNSMEGKEFDYVGNVDYTHFVNYKKKMFIMVMEKLDPLDIRIDGMQFMGIMKWTKGLGEIYKDQGYIDEPTQNYIDRIDDKKVDIVPKELLNNIQIGISEVYEHFGEYIKLDVHEENILKDPRTGNYKIIDMFY